MSKQLSTGIIHDIPDDMKDIIFETKGVLDLWKSLTPLARNEFICWITSAKKTETRIKRIKWMCSNLLEGKRRPCCWPGCSHRNKTGK